MFFSVVTIVRNDKIGLEKTMNSVRAQSFSGYEWIVVDGGSSDDTVSALIDAENLNMSIISEPDEGIYDAMNKGISRASGEYIVFMNAGDVFYDNQVLMKVFNAASKNGCDFLYGDSCEYSAGVLKNKSANDISNINRGMPACHQAMFYKRLKINSTRYDKNMKVAGDYKFTAQFLKTNKIIEYINEPLCIFDANGISSRRRGIGRVENWIIQRDVIGLSAFYRIKNRFRYILSAFLMDYMPSVYNIFRYK